MTTFAIRRRLTRELRDLLPAADHARVLAHYEANGDLRGCELDPLVRDCLELAAESERPLSTWR
jgi:hypothetical protein